MYNKKQTKLHIFDNGSEKKVVIRSCGGAHLMCIWDTNDNTLTTGQWLCKKKLQINKCCYKSDGKFIYRCSQFGCDTRIVECTPPYFTAHQMWEGHCSQEFVKIRSLNNNGYECDFTPPTTIISDKLVAPDGTVIHDFSKDIFTTVTPPENYEIGERIRDTVLRMML